MLIDNALRSVVEYLVELRDERHADGSRGAAVTSDRPPSPTSRARKRTRTRHKLAIRKFTDRSEASYDRSARAGSFAIWWLRRVARFALPGVRRPHREGSCAS